MPEGLASPGSPWCLYHPIGENLTATEGWDLADPPPEGVTADDLGAMLTAAGQRATEPDVTADLSFEVERLAALPPIEHLRQRRTIAQQQGIRVKDLDALVAEARRRATTEDSRPNANPPLDPRGRAPLFVNDADLPDTAADLATRLANPESCPMLFDRGGPVRLDFDTRHGGLVAEPLTVHGIVIEAHAVTRPWRHVWNRAGTERMDVTLPERVAKLYLERRGRWGLRQLDGIARAPLLHDDGGIRTAEGYDPDTCLWCERVPHVEVPDNPNREDADAALLTLRRAFRTFAFADAIWMNVSDAPVSVVDSGRPPGADESGFLAGLLTAVCRPSLQLAPALLVRAPQYSGGGTGKGLLVRTICAVAYGARPRAMTAGPDAEELEKRIAAALTGADFALFLDNVNGRALKSDTLASAITERPSQMRPMGTSRIMLLNAAAFVAVTGNGLSLSEDLARRFITVDLDAGAEDPEARPLTGDFVAEVMGRRAELLTAALTIWRWGRRQGALLVEGKPLGSFDQWARWCRDPLVALGCVDPVLRIAETKARDPRRTEVAETFDFGGAATRTAR